MSQMMQFNHNDGLINVDDKGEYLHIVYERGYGETLDTVLDRARKAGSIEILHDEGDWDTYPNVSFLRMAIPAEGNRVRLTFTNEGGE